MNLNNEKEYNEKDAKNIKDCQTVRISRNSKDYVYATSSGKELSINVARTMNLLDSQPEATDDDFYDICITEKELAERINVRLINLHKEIIEGDFIEELRTSAFVYKVVNEKGEVKYADYLNAMSRVTYDEGKLYLRKNPDMNRFLLKLGKDNPYYEIFTKSANALAKHKQIELYKLIENELSRLQYEFGMKSKIQMLEDHKWHELHISIYKIRQSTFSLETYSENFKFVSTLLKRQLATISEKTDIEIDYQNVKTNKRGDDAEYVIMNVRRKIISYKLPKDKEEIVKYFDDEAINEHFINYIEQNGIDKIRIKNFKDRLKQCVQDTLKSDSEEIDADIAIRIIEYSARKGYKEFYPLKDEELKMIKNKKSDLLRPNYKGLKEIEDLYQQQVKNKEEDDE